MTTKDVTEITRYAREIASAPLKLAGIELACAVVEMPDGEIRRLLSARKFNLLIGRDGHINRRNSNPEDLSVSDTPPFLASKSLEPFIQNELITSSTPLWYKTKTKAKAAGYPATLLADVCDVYIEAWQAGALHHTQHATAMQCLKISRALMRTGIDALIDEVTGYQEQRHKNALQELFSLYLGDHAIAWKREFDPSFAHEIYRIHGKSDQFKTDNPWRHVWVCRFLGRVIWTSRAFPQEIIDEIRRRNPRKPSGQYRYRYHQLLNEWFGKPELVTHRIMVMRLLRQSSNEIHFWHLLDMVCPDRQRVLPLVIPNQAFPTKAHHLSA